MDDHIEQEAARIFAFKTESEIEARLIEGGGMLFDSFDKPAYVLALRKIDEARLRGTLSQVLSEELALRRAGR